jgi:hypothetical protein
MIQRFSSSKLSYAVLRINNFDHSCYKMTDELERIQKEVVIA